MNTAAAPKPAITFDPAGPADAGLVTELAARIWPDCFKDILSPEQVGNILGNLYSSESLRQQMDDGQRFILVRMDGVAVGYASGYRDDTVVWIKKLYLLASVRGMGLGAQLMHSVVAACGPAAYARLLVHRDNVQAQDFYTRHGFIRIGEVPVKMGDFDFVDYLYETPLSGNAHVSADHA